MAASSSARVRKVVVQVLKPLLCVAVDAEAADTANAPGRTPARQRRARSAEPTIFCR